MLPSQHFLGRRANETLKNLRKNSSPKKEALMKNYIFPLCLSFLFIQSAQATYLRVLNYESAASPSLIRNASGECEPGAKLTGKGSGLTSNAYATCDTAGKFAMSFKLTSTVGEKSATLRSANAMGETASVKLQFSVIVKDETLVLPPPYTKRQGESEKYGYLDSMMVAVGAPNGFELGRIPILEAENPANIRFSLSGDSAGLTIDATSGMISVVQGALITTPGTKDIIVTAQGVSKVTATTIRIRVVDSNSKIRFVDAQLGDDGNSGLLPHAPKKTLSAAGSGASMTLALKRGTSFSGKIVLYPGTNVQSYGDPSLPRPVVVGNSTYVVEPGKNATKGTYLTNLTNISLQDLDIRGGQRGVYLNGGSNLRILRVRVSDNVQSAASSGMFVRNFTGDIAIRHCETENVYGDGIYMVRVNGTTAPLEIAYNNLGVPQRADADAIQFTNEGDTAVKGYNVWIHHNVLHQSINSSSGKGALALEGIEKWLIENNVVEGKYFGISAIGPRGVIRNNNIRDARMPTSSSGYQNASGILVGGDVPSYQLQIYDNLIANSYNGFAISGFNDPTGGFQRYDMEISNNKIMSCTRVAKFDRAWSGFVIDNIGIANLSNQITFSGNGLKIATGGSYTSQTKNPNYFQASPGPEFTVLPQLSGTPRDGFTLTVNPGNAGDDTVFTYQWRINGVPVAGAQQASFKIPTGTSSRLQGVMPSINNLNLPEISAVVTARDSAGNINTEVARFGDKIYIQITP